MNVALPDEQDRIDREASGWLVRQEEGLGPGGRDDLEAWLAADQRHRDTFQAMQRTWNDIPEISSLADIVPMPAQIGPVPANDRAPSHRPWSWWLAGGFAAAAAAVAIIWVPGSWLRPGQHYSTQLAETRIVTLPDGSSVTLGGKSSLSFRFTGAERRVVLSGGEAFFDVIHSGARPFVVEAGHSLVRDIGTKFDINLTNATVRVSVVEGAVQVSPPSGQKSVSKLIRAGEGTEISLLSTTGARGFASPIVATHGLPAAGAWREGRLVFDDVRLADMAADVNRYYGPGIKLVGSDVADLRVTASLKTSEIPAFMSALSASLPVRTDEAVDGSFTIHSSKP